MLPRISNDEFRLLMSISNGKIIQIEIETNKNEHDVACRLQRLELTRCFYGENYKIKYLKYYISDYGKYFINSYRKLNPISELVFVFDK